MKSTTLKNPRNHLAHACTADRLVTRKSPAAAIDPGWSLYVGVIKLTILNRDHPNDSTIGRPQIDAIIARATAEHAAANSQPD